jgi:hypothetical protein
VALQDIIANYQKAVKNSPIPLSEGLAPGVGEDPENIYDDPR